MIENCKCGLSHKLYALEKENDELKNTIEQLEKEKLEYASYCKKLKTILSSYENTIKSLPSDILKLSDKLTNTLNLCRIINSFHYTLNGESNTINRLALSCNMYLGKFNNFDHLCNKKQIVSPHIVNGHVLHIPTINLTRILPPRNVTNNNTKNNSINENTLTSSNDNNNPSSNAEIPELPTLLPSSCTKVTVTLQKLNNRLLRELCGSNFKSRRKINLPIRKRNLPRRSKNVLNLNEKFLLDKQWKKK